MRIFLCILLSLTLVDKSRPDRLAIFPQPQGDLCKKTKCGSRPHTVCSNLEPHKRCSKFGWIKLEPRVIHTMLYGHNGVRNKMAEEWGIGNMNLLHWSKELVVVARHFLTACRKERDDCDFLVWKNTTLASSYFFSPFPPSARWMGKVIRNWYFELGFEVEGIQTLIEARESKKAHVSFSNLIWPTTEFVGCAAAKMFNGYLATCYYHPAPTFDWNDFRFALGCSKCPKSRRTCSRHFTNLCGIDIAMASADRAFYKKSIIASVLLMFLYRSYALTIQ